MSQLDRSTYLLHDIIYQQSLLWGRGELDLHKIALSTNTLTATSRSFIGKGRGRSNITTFMDSDKE